MSRCSGSSSERAKPQTRQSVRADSMPVCPVFGNFFFGRISWIACGLTPSRFHLRKGEPRKAEGERKMVPDKETGPPARKSSMAGVGHLAMAACRQMFGDGGCGVQRDAASSHRHPTDRLSPRWHKDTPDVCVPGDGVLSVKAHAHTGKETDRYNVREQGPNERTPRKRHR